MRTIWRWIKANFIWFALTAFATAQVVEQWAEERVEELWRAIVTVIALPALFIITGLALGTFGVAWKATMIGIGLPIAIINLAILAWRHAVAGVALGVLIKWALREKFSFVGDTKKVIVEGIRFYAVDVLMGLLYTEIVIGMIAVATPAHEAPGYAYYAALAGLGLAVYAVRTGWGKNVWASIVKFVLVVTVVWSLLVIFFPPLRGFPTLVRNTVNEFLFNPAGATVQIFFGIIAILLLASFVVPSLVKKEQERIGRAVRVGTRLVAITLLAYWFIWGTGYVKAKEWIGEPRLKPVPTAAAPQLQYVGLAKIPGSPAPRQTPATMIVPKTEGLWEVFIDGSNEYGRREPANGHWTSVRLKPGQTVVVRHVSGTLAYNTHGDRFPLCGDGGGAHRGEQFRFPDVRPQSVGVTLVPSEVKQPAQFRWWRCGEDRVALKWSEESIGEAELVFFFNTNERYLTPAGPSAGHGFAFAGWDGERARFEVRLVT